MSEDIKSACRRKYLQSSWNLNSSQPASPLRRCFGKVITLLGQYWTFSPTDSVQFIAFLRPVVANDNSLADIMKISHVLGLVIAVFLEQSSQQCFPPYAGNQPEKKAHSDLYSGQQGFSLALLNAINKVKPNENLFFSPYSTYHALLIAYFMSGGQTESYLKKVLRLDESQVLIMYSVNV